ncbi:MAG: FAD-dependent monooxygenase [Hyphomicrobiales bacterium]|nr:FAD-dependent monooxygenase [Hyphomicrobiales bacterium]
MNGRTEPIAVVGGGIGGLAAALFLSRAGFEVALIEKRTGVEEEGAGLQLSPNASRVLFEAGMGPPLSRRASAPERVRIRRALDARELASIPLGDDIEERHGAPYLVIHRADLAGVLLDAVRSEARVQLLYGREAQGHVEHDHGVTLSLRSENSAQSTFDAAALVLADGLWSTNHPSNAPPRFSGFCAWRALVPATSAPSFARAREVGLWLGPRAHLVHYALGNRDAVNLVAVIEDECQQQGWSREGDPKGIGQAFATWNEAARSLIACAPAWKCWSLFDRQPARRWGRGLVTLLGDAAHPMLPFLAQGAAMAIEDAAVLAIALSPLTHAGIGHKTGTREGTARLDRRREVERALRRYERARASRTARAQREARWNKLAYHSQFPLSAPRDLILSRSSGPRLLSRYDWLYGWRAEDALATE